MRTNGKWNNSQAPLHQLKRYSALMSEPSIPEGLESCTPKGSHRVGPTVTNGNRKHCVYQFLFLDCL